MTGCTTAMCSVESIVSMVSWMDFERRYLINVKLKQYVLNNPRINMKVLPSNEDIPQHILKSKRKYNQCSV
jgi:hypothetical protein